MTRQNFKKKIVKSKFWINIFIYLFPALITSMVNAQIDAGALQQNLQQQLPLPSPLSLPQPGKPEPLKQTAPKEGEVRFVIQSFVLEGINILPEAEIQAVLRPWVSRSVNFDDLQKACDAVIDYYRKKGYSVQAILPPQKLANGVVKILITEAKLGSVIVENPQGPTRFNTDLAAKFITDANPIGDYLNINKVERALIILNETPGVIATSQLEPSVNDGETALKMQLSDSSLVQARGELNNYGSRTTGANQATVAINLNNPSGFGDQATVNGIVSDGSSYVQGAYSLPANNDGLRLGIAASYLSYKNVSSYANNNSGFGDAWTTGISAAYPLIRSQSANLNITMAYNIKSYMNKNKISDSTISSYAINNLSFGISGIQKDSIGGGALSTGQVTVALGNLAISATSIEGYGTNTPSNFAKLNFSSSRNQRLTEDGLNSIYLALSGQFASVNLNSAEQFYLGGPYGVSAYPVAQSSGSQGMLATLELRRELPQNLTLSSFFDWGAVQQYKATFTDWQGQTNANNTYSLMGAGLGLKWNYQNWNVAGVVAWMVGKNPLYNQYGQPTNTDGTNTQPRAWISASYLF